MAAKLSLNEAKERAGRFCAFRERSPNEVIEKIRSWGLTQGEAETIVDQLIELNYIDEQRFANAYCHDKFEFNSWGKQKIRSGIFPHRIAPRIIENALDRIDSDRYENRLRELAQKKWDKLDADDVMKRKQKTVNYLANKGFEPDLIWSAIAHMEKGQ